MKKRSSLLIFVSIAMMGFLCIGTLLSPEIEFSENENRYLQDRPRFSMNHFVNGNFSDETEKYFNDHILGRVYWVKAMAIVAKEFGVRDINGVYLCKEGRFIEKITEQDFDWKRFEDNLKQVKMFMYFADEKGISVQVMLVPTAAFVYQENLPQYAPKFDEKGAYQIAKDFLGNSLIDLRNPLLEATEDTFYATDHHWTGYGAYLGAKLFLEKLGKPLPDFQDMMPRTLTTEFRGSLYSKVLLDSIDNDTIQTPAQGIEDKYQVYIDGNTYSSCYFKSYLEKKDKYAVFFGGNYDMVDILTEHKNQERLLVIKDSFANSFVPYLLRDFSKITMVDTRYYQGDLRRIAEKYDQVLVLYSISQFAQEKLSLTQTLLQ